MNLYWLIPEETQLVLSLEGKKNALHFSCKELYRSILIVTSKEHYVILHHLLNLAMMVRNPDGNHPHVYVFKTELVLA